MSLHVSNYVCDFQSSQVPEPWNSVRATLERLKAEAIAELDAEDGFHVDHHDRFRRSPAKDFNKKPDHYIRHCIGSSYTTPNCLGPDNIYKPGYLCAAHVVGIADPAMYGKHSSHNNQEHYNKQLKLQREKDQISWTKVVDMDHATSGKAPSNELGESRGLKEKLIDQI